MRRPHVAALLAAAAIAAGSGASGNTPGRSGQAHSAIEIMDTQGLGEGVCFVFRELRGDTVDADIIACSAALRTGSRLEWQVRAIRGRFLGDTMPPAVDTIRGGARVGHRVRYLRAESDSAIRLRLEATAVFRNEDRVSITGLYTAVVGVDRDPEIRADWSPGILARSGSHFWTEDCHIFPMDAADSASFVGRAYADTWTRAKLLRSAVVDRSSCPECTGPVQCFVIVSRNGRCVDWIGGGPCRNRTTCAAAISKALRSCRFQAGTLGGLRRRSAMRVTLQLE